MRVFFLAFHHISAERKEEEAAAAAAAWTQEKVPNFWESVSVFVPLCFPLQPL
jgi:hypothetical protein